MSRDSIGSDAFAENALAEDFAAEHRIAAPYFREWLSMDKSQSDRRKLLTHNSFGRFQPQALPSEAWAGPPFEADGFYSTRPRKNIPILPFLIAREANSRNRRDSPPEEPCRYYHSLSLVK